jgi:hypothetical protein
MLSTLQFHKQEHHAPQDCGKTSPGAAIPRSHRRGTPRQKNSTSKVSALLRWGEETILQKQVLAQATALAVRQNNIPASVQKPSTSKVSALLRGGEETTLQQQVLAQTTILAQTTALAVRKKTTHKLSVSSLGRRTRENK